MVSCYFFIYIYNCLISSLGERGEASTISAICVVARRRSGGGARLCFQKELFEAGEPAPAPGFFRSTSSYKRWGRSTACAALEANCIESGLYYMSSEVWNVYKNTLGVTTGALFIPFKYHFSDHAVTPGGSLGVYAGVKWGNKNNGDIATVVAAGLSAVQQGQATANFSATTANGVSNAGDTLYGATFAVGLIGRVGSSGPQFGILGGKDFIDKSKNYKYDGKWWLSVSIGYAFSN